MLTDEIITYIVKSIYKTADQFLGKNFRKLILYGSYARGDFDLESDLDIMLIADIQNEECYKVRKHFSSLLTELGIKYDILISLHVLDEKTFTKWHKVVPFYINVEKEGVVISA